MTDLRREPIGVGALVLQQFVGYRPVEQSIGFRGMVASGTQDAGFVFDLHHDHRLLACIEFLNVAQQGAKRPRVRVEILPRERRQYFERMAIGGYGAGESPRC